MNELFNPPVNPVRRYRHGHKPAGGISPEYAVWNGMRARCNNPQNPNYERYGGRGIKVCDRWQSDFVAFLEDMGRRPKGKTLERRDNDGDYTPENCIWATAQDQANNRRSSRLITHDGETMTLAQWGRRIGLRTGTLHARFKAGWTVERALAEPLHGFVRKDERGEPRKVRVYETLPERVLQK